MGIAEIGFRLFSRLRGARAINLIGEAREGGYVFVRSPELPGFSYMLAPNEHDDAAVFFKTIEAPLKAFIAAECKAGERSKAVRITSTHQTDATSYLAELCPT